MSDSRHVRLNSRWYRIAEDAEGEGYRIRREPLRVPNSQVVQGAEKFQLRPDLLQWSLTNWSEGEGQIKWTATEPGRSYLLMNVDPFSQRGNLRLGPLMSVINYSSSPLNKRLMMVAARNDGITGVTKTPTGNVLYYKFNVSSKAFSAPVDSGINPTTGIADVCGDSEALYWIGQTTGNLYKYDSSTTLHNDQTGASGLYTNIVELGDYVYIYDPEEGKVYEVSKATANTATPEVAIYDITASGGSDIHNAALSYMVAGDNRVYLLQTQEVNTKVHEIVPTSAAATGYGREIANLPGITGYGLNWFGGFLVLYAYSGGFNGDQFVLYYIQPNQSMGTFGVVRSHLGNGPAGTEFNPGKATMNYVGFVGPDWDSTTNAPSFFLLDTITGGFAQVSSQAALSDPSGAAVTGKIESIDGVWVIPTIGTYHYTYCTDPEKYMATGYTISPYNDFQLADEKVLRDITITCEPLPANTTIQVQYDLGDGVWITAGTLSTDDSEGATYTVSSDTTTRIFRHMRVKTILSTTNEDVTPVVRSLETRASVVKYIRIWELLIDLSDDHPQFGRSGSEDIDELLALAENTVYEFTDAYGSHAEGTSTEYNVEMDSLNIILSQPGEGVAQVVLRET